MAEEEEILEPPIGGGFEGKVYLTKSGKVVKIMADVPENFKSAYRQFLLTDFFEKCYTNPPFAHIFELSTSNGKIKLKMEKYYKDLSARMKTITRDDAYKFMDQIFSGISMLIDLEYVFQDLKPGNILCNIHGSIFLTDFGSGVFLTEIDGKRQFTFMTNKIYTDPELSKGWFDVMNYVYSLGVIFLEMLHHGKIKEKSLEYIKQLQKGEEEKPASHESNDKSQSQSNNNNEETAYDEMLTETIEHFKKNPYAIEFNDISDEEKEFITFCISDFEGRYTFEEAQNEFKKLVDLRSYNVL
ncbi:CAMK family protein kinase [Trichomonas vaginalis G3]|uniref:CAMK family protein kinase n=1 Tax=Trichomonas vaginalis (strain ATCC PRA-98 / G3) TaxID=412133 RepID=A2E807_TRIV3|nr:protein kinase-like (PK-like) family [Trichomonas vaginalis G3]EAY11233.1 CAMK family protein kinase [Trichomonas vaginalis G3]KAI5551380.1 protein kinase-like (PK-like) family [Trichomonas vaginalis G3]|eukprot:XP_001323456.1 CAMK family protein kinase [Trichomonas vaginalis G3]